MRFFLKIGKGSWAKEKWQHKSPFSALHYSRFPIFFFFAFLSTLYTLLISVFLSLQLGNQLVWQNEALVAHGHWPHFALVKDDNHLVLLVDVELLVLLDMAEAIRIAIFLEEVALVLVSLHFLLHLLNDVLADGLLVVAAALEQVAQLDPLAAGLAEDEVAAVFTAVSLGHYRRQLDYVPVAVVSHLLGLDRQRAIAALLQGSLEFLGQTVSFLGNFPVDCLAALLGLLGCRPGYPADGNFINGNIG